MLDGIVPFLVMLFRVLLFRAYDVLWCCRLMLAFDGTKFRMFHDGAMTGQSVVIIILAGVVLRCVAGALAVWAVDWANGDVALLLIAKLGHHK